MKKVLLVIFILILLSIFIVRRSNDPKIIISRLSDKSGILSGELRYRIYLLGILPVGEAILKPAKIEDYKGQQVYHLTAVAESLRLFSRFFSGYAILDSYIDKQQLNPILFRQKLTVSGKKDIEKEVFYDQKNGVMSIAGVRRQILPNTQDPLSLILNIKRMDFDKARDFEMNINTNQKNYILEAKTEQRDLSINKKIYKIVLAGAEIRRRDKNPYHKSSIAMVLLRGKENIPVLIKVFASGVLINARLIEIR